MLHFATLGRLSVISSVHFVLVLPRNLSKLLAIQGLEAATCCTQCQASDWSHVQTVTYSDPSYLPESIWSASALGLPLPQSQKPQVDAFDVSGFMQFYKLQESDQKHTVCQRPHRSCTGRAD